MKKGEFGKETNTAKKNGLTRREVLQKMGKAVYVAPVLVAINQTPGNKEAPGRQRPQSPGGSGPPPPPPPPED